MRKTKTLTLKRIRQVRAALLDVYQSRFDEVSQRYLTAISDTRELLADLEDELERKEK